MAKDKDNNSGAGETVSTPMDLPGNSYSNRKDKKTPVDKTEEAPKKLEKVIKGEVIQSKKGFGSKFKETFGGDDARSVGSYIFFDVIIPAAKAMLADAASQGAERLLFGDTRGRSRVSGGSRAGSTTYSRMYNRDDDRSSRRELSNRARSTHDFDEIILQERGEAEEVLDQLTTLVDDYGYAKISDLYELVGITGNYIDEKWGWNDLSRASTSRVRKGYLLNLPKPIHLD